MGLGEASNEVPSGGGWGRYQERYDRLVEAILTVEESTMIAQKKDISEPQAIESKPGTPPPVPHVVIIGGDLVDLQ